MKSEGNAGNYVSGRTGLPVPMANTDARRTHTPPKPKPTGLDWSAHRAPDAAPDEEATVERTRQKCKGCVRRPRLEDLVDGYCPVCVIAVGERFADLTPLPVPGSGHHRLAKVKRVRRAVPSEPPAPPTVNATPVPVSVDPASIESPAEPLLAPSDQVEKRATPDLTRIVDDLVDAWLTFKTRVETLLFDALALEPLAEVTGPPTTASIRVWARDHGYTVPLRGPLPHAVHDAYAEAHP